MVEWYWLVGSIIIAFIFGHMGGWRRGQASGWIKGWNQCQDGYLQTLNMQAEDDKDEAVCNDKD